MASRQSRREAANLSNGGATMEISPERNLWLNVLTWDRPQDYNLECFYIIFFKKSICEPDILGSCWNAFWWNKIWFVRGFVIFNSLLFVALRTLPAETKWQFTAVAKFMNLGAKLKISPELNPGVVLTRKRFQDYYFECFYIKNLKISICQPDILGQYWNARWRTTKRNDDLFPFGFFLGCRFQSSAGGNQVDGLPLVPSF